MRKRNMFMLATLIFVFGISINSYAMRCGSEIVDKGDTASSVYQKCGRPGYQEAVQEDTKGTFKGEGYNYGQYTDIKGTYESTKQKTEKWYYNCGRYDFVYVLIIRGGKVISIDTDRRGSGMSECQGK